MVLVDQFEELFRYQNYAGQDEAEAFVTRLIEIKGASTSAKAQGNEFPIYVTITMRSEFLGACSLLAGLAEAINEGAFLTPRMSRAQCELAIRGPAQVCGIGIEDALVNKLLNDMADLAAWDESTRDQQRPQTATVDQLSLLARRADQLPLMQHALNQLWREAKESTKHPDAPDHRIVLTLDAYNAIGELSGALDRHVDTIFRELGSERELVTEGVFRALTSGTIVADAVRWPTPFGDLVKRCGSDRATVEAVVNAFRAPGCNFLVPAIEHKPELDDETTIDITHESLIRQWKRLSEWLEKEAHAAQEWRRLVDLAQGDVVLRGLRLTNAMELFNDIKKKPAWADRYGNSFEQVKRLINASRTRRHIVRGGGVVAVGALAALCGVIYLGVLSYRTSVETSARNYQLAVNSAQALLKQVGDSFGYGSISVKGARDLLKTADTIVEQVDVPWSIIEIGRLKLNLLPARTLEIAGLKISLLLRKYDLIYTLGDYDEAYSIGKRAKEVVETLPRSEQEDPQGVVLAYAISWRMADALADQGNDPDTLARGLEEFRRAEGLARKLVEMTPEDGWRQRNIMFVLQKIGDISQMKEEYDDAIANYNQAIKIAEKLVRRPSAPSVWKRDLGNCHSRLGQVFALKKDFKPAFDQLSAALVIRTELADADRDDDVAQSNLGRSHIEFARLFEQQNKLDKVLGEYRAAELIREKLVKKDPSNAARLSQLAPVYMYVGDVLRKQWKWEDALQEYNRALNIRQDLATRDPRNLERQDVLAASRHAFADMLTLQNRFEEALQNYEDAALALEDLADNAAKDRPKKAADYRGRAFDARVKMGDIFVSKDNHDTGLGEYRNALALALAQQLADQDGNDASWQTKLASVHEKIGDQLALKQDPGGALEQYNAALAIIKKLSEDRPNDMDWIKALEFLQSKIQALVTKQ